MTSPKTNSSRVALPVSMERELQIQLCPLHSFEFIGSAAQLIDEGLIPEGFAWPHGRTRERWEAGGVEYRLMRCRPSDHKGPMNSWLELDHWSVVGTVKGRDLKWHQRHDLERRAQVLTGGHFHLDSQGAPDDAHRRGLYSEARSDKAFQAFKAHIPGLVPSKGGRKS